MKTLKLMHRESDQGNLLLANPGSPIGYVNGAYILEITNIPDNVSNTEVLKLANATAFMAAYESIIIKPRYSYEFHEFGVGKIIHD